MLAGMEWSETEWNGSKHLTFIFARINNGAVINFIDDFIYKPIFNYQDFPKKLAYPILDYVYLAKLWKIDFFVIFLTSKALLNFGVIISGFRNKFLDYLSKILKIELLYLAKF